jgi:WD40 repeat protein
VVSLALSPDGSLLASGAGDATVRVWELATGEELGRLRFETSKSACVRSLSFSKDGRWLAAGIPGEFAVMEMPLGPGTPALRSATR